MKYDMNKYKNRRNSWNTRSIYSICRKELQPKHWYGRNTCQLPDEVHFRVGNIQNVDLKH